MARTRGKLTEPTEAELTIPVSFGDVSIGETTCRIAVTVARKDLTLTKADSQVCAKRLVGSIVCVPGNNNPDQPPLGGMDAETSVPGAFDVKRISFNKKTIAFGLTFSIESVNIEDLAHFAKRSGKILVTEIIDIPKEEKSPAAAEDDGDE